MKKSILLSLFCIISIVACQTTKEEPTTIKIAFGSCAHEDKPQPMLDVAAGLEPDVFVYLGDNIYGDTREMDTLKAKYNRLAAKPSFQNLINSTKVLATWDDHDYGENDAGKYYPFKAESKEVFMDFWKVPEDDDRRTHEGIYGVEYLKKEGLTVQFILLDTRTFRDDLLVCPEGSDSTFCKNDYQINNHSDSTFLGTTQWKWLEEQLKASADIRIIASSNQFGHEYNGWESWTNVPKEQKQMTNLIQSTQANGVIFISGDVHWGEISKMKISNQYPIYDVTSSGITQTWDDVEPNQNRVGEVISQNNIGCIEIKAISDKTEINLSLYDITEQAVVKHKIDLEDISF